ncbi:MAG: hypothetical protein J1F38_01275 [Muribaculaceae bacterium]|nr:hypothetical protein [Muribaculaceae bacterium]
MKNFLLLLTLSSLLLASCVKIKKSDAEYEREQWIESFADSIAFFKEKAQHLEEELDKINGKISSQLDNYEKVNNPREVTGYYLLKGWQSKLPLTSTGIYARINENEKLELLATLSGAVFNQIAVGHGVERIESDVVPHDQAFNYRHETYNTVYFSGPKADSIAEYISNHHDDKIQLQYVNGSSRKDVPIPENQRQMIHATWELYSLQLKSHELQKEYWLCNKKIEAFRRILESQQNIEKN